MGLLVNGKWQDEWYENKDGNFIRENSKFHNTVSKNSKFKPEANRYHLYVSLACPWAHRTLIFRKLKKLETIISVDIVHPHMLEHGWEFKSDSLGKFQDSLYSLQYLHQIYTKANPDYTGRVTVPVLWDKTEATIVNNESSQIIRFLNSEFNDFTDMDYNFYPAELKEEIDSINDFIYNNINNGVYKCGFATAQEAYENACQNLFMALDKIEARLTGQKFLVGDTLTEADWRIFTTLIRFDLVYYIHFKTSIKQIRDYPAIYQYLQKLYNYDNIKATVDVEHIKQHYYYSHQQINPYRIVPCGRENIFAK